MVAVIRHDAPAACILAYLDGIQTMERGCRYMYLMHYVDADATRRVVYRLLRRGQLTRVRRGMYRGLTD